MIGVGVIGAGYIGNVHLETINRIGGVKLRSVYDKNSKLSREAAKTHNVDKVADRVDELISDPEIDVVHVCSPNKYHFEQSLQVLNAGKNLFLEKPLAMTSKEGEKLVETAEEFNAITGIGFCYRYYPVVQEMAHRIRNGAYGNVRMVTGSWLQDWLSQKNDYTWRLDSTQSGKSNVAADLGSHWFDLVQFVTGLSVTDVFADLATLIPERIKPKGQVLAFQKSESNANELIKIEVEDYASFTFRMKGIIPGSFTTSQVCPGRKSETEIQIYCSEGSLAWNHKRSDELWIGKRNGANEIFIENPTLQSQDTAAYATLPAGHPLGYRDAMLNMLRNFYSAVEIGEEGDGDMRPTLETGLRQMKILDGVLESNSIKGWIRVKI